MNRFFPSGHPSKFRASVFLLILSGLLGYAHSPGQAQESGLSTPAKPSIKSFVASSTKIKAGQSLTLTAVFSNGKGAVTPGKLTITSGKALRVTPAANTTYTLKVTNSAGSAVTKTVSVKVTPAPPAIASFMASPATIAAGQTTSLTAVFSNGKGAISPGKIVPSSGAAFTVSPVGTTKYTLTVTNSAGVKLTAQATVQVTPVTPSTPDLGVNIGWVNDWDPTQMFADAMKQARKFGSVTTPYDEAASVDAQGWPLQDAGVLIIVNNPGSWSNGNYALSFTGQAIVRTWGDKNVSIGAVTYDSTTNTSTAIVTAASTYQTLGLAFTQTQRTPSSDVGSGVTNVSLMRPTVSGTPHAPGTLFTDVFLNRLKYFSAVRLMDYLQINSSTETVWGDRSIPAHASQQQVPPYASLNVQSSNVTGASYEYAIQLANQAGKDLWLSVPHLAFGGTYAFSSTDWANNLALLLRYGSDVNGIPYTGAAGSDGANPQPDTGPVNPPLKPGLHVYLEYSNEFWSGVGTQSAWIVNQANAAIAAGDPDLDWDHDANTYDVVWRINAKGLMLLANAFENVFGPEAFGSIYRPVFGGQIANSGTYGGLAYLDSQYGGANQYVWAIAGAPYADFSGDTPKNALTYAQVLSGMQTYETTKVSTWISNLAAVASAEKLAGGMLAYEGGQGALYSTAGAVAAQAKPGIRAVTTAQLDSWFAWGGGTFFYYKLCSMDMWGLSTNIGYDIDADPGYSATPSKSAEAQPKWGAIKQTFTTGH